MTERATGWLWTGIALFLVAWFIGLLLKWGPLANLLLVVAAVLLVVQVINERNEES
jgi:O-antigen ligase